MSNEYILNENFNGKINLNINKLENNPFFDKLKINANFGSNSDLSFTSFINEKIANLSLTKVLLYEDRNNLFLKENVDFVVNDLDKFYNKLCSSQKK